MSEQQEYKCEVCGDTGQSMDMYGDPIDCPACNMGWSDPLIVQVQESPQYPTHMIHVELRGVPEKTQRLEIKWRVVNE